MKPEASRQGFTLIELMIVTAIIATLMGMVFRLAGTGSDNRCRAITIERIQRIENALSGYYAAYGSYPPVPLQGRSRSIYAQVDENFVQDPSGGKKGSLSGSADAVWNEMGSQILAACKAQPVAVYFPFNSKNNQNREMVRALSDQRVSTGASKSAFRLIENTGGFDLDSGDWRKTAVFQFGLLSFLLPRYLFMLEGEKEFYDHVNSKTRRRGGQWAANNQLPCRMDTGEQFQSWDAIQGFLNAGSHYSSGGSSSGSMEAGMISNLTSQSVCARWMPNFEGIISGGRTFFGVKTADGDRPYLSVSKNSYISLHSPNGYAGNGSGGSLYILDGMTIRDGWGNEFFYYSEPPFQSYQLWSAGPNGRTFPVWYDRGKLSGSELKAVKEWTDDDISGLNN